MAAPHVAGAIAVLKQKVPAASACKIEHALKASGLPTVDNRSNGLHTKPRIRVNLALARLQAPVAPPNNNFADATVIEPPIYNATFRSHNIAATREAGEARHVVATSDRTIWYRWTPAVSGPTTFDTIGSQTDTVIAVYRGGTSVTAPGPLVAQNDNIAAGQTNSRVTFNAVAGQRYNIVIAGKTASQECGLQLNLSRPPVNDNFASARLVSFTAYTEAVASGSNVGATFETGEPNHHLSTNATSSVWFRFVAPVSGRVRIDTWGSGFYDTVLAVYTGTTLPTLTRIVSNAPVGTGWAEVYFNMVAGTTYRVAVAGKDGKSGRYRVWFTPEGVASTGRKVTLVSDE